MTLELRVLAGRGAPALHRLEGPATLGGSRADAVCVAGLPPAALRLEPCAAGLILQPADRGLKVAERPVSPGARRLLRPGERALLRGAVLELAGLPPAGATRASASALLRRAADAAPPGPCLLVLSGPEAGARLPLGPELVLGRGRGAPLRLADPTASRCHARLRLGPAGASVEDLGAKNRLRLNGVPAERGPMALRPGDRLTVGATELCYDDERLPPPAARSAGRPRPLCRPRAARARAARRPLLAAALLAMAAAAIGLVASCG